jgi:hypothetical protein
MITKQQLISSGYELVLTSDCGLAFCFETKSKCQFCIKAKEGIIKTIRNETNENSCFVFPNPFTDIVLFNNFVNLYL